MLEYYQNQRALLHVRLLNTSGAPTPGITSGQITVTLEKPDGTIVAVTIDGVNNTWTEVTSGAFLGQGKYDLTLVGSLFDQLGGFVVATSGGAGSSLFLARTVVNIVSAVWEEPALSHTTNGTMGQQLNSVSGGADTVAPQISNMSPSGGTTITASTPISFDITDTNSSIANIMISIGFPNGTLETAFDGSSFRGPYNGYSTRTSITNGFHFLLVRGGGWLGTPSLEIFAIDVHGNVTT